jgi:hypothetical protein
VSSLSLAAAIVDVARLPGYSNAARTDQEEKNDREIDRAESTIKGRLDAKKLSSVGRCPAARRVIPL